MMIDDTLNSTTTNMHPRHQAVVMVVVVPVSMSSPSVCVCVCVLGEHLIKRNGN